MTTKKGKAAGGKGQGQKRTSAHLDLAMPTRRSFISNETPELF